MGAHGSGCVVVSRSCQGADCRPPICGAFSRASDTLTVDPEALHKGGSWKENAAPPDENAHYEEQEAMEALWHGGGVLMQKLPKAEASAENTAREEATKVQAFLKANGFDGVRAKRRKLMKVSYPLHTAVLKADADMVRLLLLAGADPLQK